MVKASTIPRRDFWTPRTVAWYERANERSDYAATIFGATADLLADGRTVLDVGAGFGALAVPLASRMSRVTALEPSIAMSEALERAAARRGLSNLTLIRAAWGSVTVESHDVVLCAHVGPLLRPGAAFLSEVSRSARVGVVLVRDMPGSGDKFFFRELYPRLLGRPYERSDDYEDTLATLAALGIQARMTAVTYSSDQPFDDFEDACEFWMEYLGTADPKVRRFLDAWLPSRLRREGDHWIAPYEKQAAVLQWRVRP